MWRAVVGLFVAAAALIGFAKAVEGNESGDTGGSGGGGGEQTGYQPPQVYGPGHPGWEAEQAGGRAEQAARDAQDAADRARRFNQ